MDLEPQPPSSSASAGGSSSSSTELVHTDYTPKLTLAVRQALRQWQAQGPSELLTDIDSLIDAAFAIHQAVFRVVGRAELSTRKNTDLDDLHKQRLLGNRGAARVLASRHLPVSWAQWE
ncbi:uncharacterized protein LAESUDRAFT_760829 [Laetiporus sulphureus 93-53]|uniref:Uncharacterized protein n=1 Tax=Laetiporus sulphureus 93-53 TaxID=1314785 RepID=A0A165DG16_9APHY|nr:uncharacterized protein LAESUDRAFT_760829 [Laetiporus sulphureus 93-53]KZT04812.1 hypothetical protein LAESUDRAFT_760829 [Laetiporus sulphureus 93-53]